MSEHDHDLRNDALAIWQAGVAAVASDRLVRQNVRVDGPRLLIGDLQIDLSSLGRIAVIGAGKAGAGMAAGLIEALGPEVLRRHRVSGWLNVPADCVRPLPGIHLHAARPAGVNEPTAEGVAGAEAILRTVETLAAGDLCLVLISGGGSALLPLPIEGLRLEDKLAVTRFLSAAGAPIEDLNCVRKQLSRIKGGRLAQACRASRLVTLIISDVLGDPLDVIASGPTVIDRSTPAEALAVLERYGARAAGIAPGVFQALATRDGAAPGDAGCPVTNLVIGNNRLAVDAAAEEARRRGYATTPESAPHSEGAAEDVGRRLADAALAMRSSGQRACLVSGGEPTVKLVAEGVRGRGGRNQQLVLAAAERWWSDGGARMALLSGGTDGEDGPTDAAGAVVDAQAIRAARAQGLDPADYLRRNDAYRFFEPLSALIKTGPTNTNVCDVRVVLTAE